MLPKVITHNTISLLILPTLVGRESLKLFEDFSPRDKEIRLKLTRNEAFDNNHILLEFKVLK